MSQTRNVLTKEENITYWKDRMYEKTASMAKQLALDMENIISNLNHVNLDEFEVRKAFSDIGSSLLVLGTAIKEAKDANVAQKDREEEAKKKETKVEAKAVIEKSEEEKKAEPVVAEAK